MITASETAVQKLRKQLADKCIEAGIGFRISIDTDETGASTFSIQIDERRREDRVISSNGLNLFLSPGVARQLEDFQLDYLDSHNGGFFLKEPGTVRDRPLQGGAG